MYSRLSVEAAKDYDKVKIALMKRYDLTEDGYRRKLRECRFLGSYALHKDPIVRGNLVCQSVCQYD